MFEINLTEPTTNLIRDFNDSTLSEAIETIFPDSNDCFFMIWNGVEIDISYKYDLDLLLVDMIDILLAIKSNDSGSFELAWPSNTFDATWLLNWKSPRLKIESIWRYANGDINELNKKNVLITNLDTFKSELMKPLTFVHEILVHAGYSKESLKYFDKLEVLTFDRTGQK